MCALFGMVLKLQCFNLAAYKTPWIARQILKDARIPVLPYTRSHTKKDRFKPWDYHYDAEHDQLICPLGHCLRHTTTDRNGKRFYRSMPKACRGCPCREKCGASEKGQKVLQRHVWQEFLDVVQAIRKTDLGKALYSMRKETIERVFADAKEKHAMRYTHHRGLARVTRWVKLKFAAMNLKKLAIWSWKTPSPFTFVLFYARKNRNFVCYLYRVLCGGVRPHGHLSNRLREERRP